MYTYAKALVRALPLLLLWGPVSAQTVGTRLQTAWTRFSSDSQLQAATASLHVVDGATGAVVFSRNAALGLQPASTQKVITAATAYELLGPDYRYATVFGYTQPSDGGLPLLVVKGSGDPSLGSWRWPHTGGEAVFQPLIRALAATGRNRLSGIRLQTAGWEDDPIPGGWIWDDLGNYFGAGAGVLNWRENQFDLLLRSGPALGSPVTVRGTNPRLYGFTVRSLAQAAAKGSGDNSYLYLPVGGAEMILRGTIPQGSDSFKISGAFPVPHLQFGATLAEALERGGVSPGPVTASSDTAVRLTELYRHLSPPLDSLVYWFNRRSINLYGEAFLRTWASEKGRADRSEGIRQLEAVWKERGIVPAELHLVDGSGLSPQNRVSTRAQVAVLRYAQAQPWFRGFYASLPEYNGMKMKSGTIHRVKGFTGYHRSAAGRTYVFSFLVNNYNGPSTPLVQKMYAVLNELK